MFEFTPHQMGHHPYLTVATATVDPSELTLPADHWLPVDERLVPSDAPQSVAGTDYDFRGRAQARRRQARHRVHQPDPREGRPAIRVLALYWAQFASCWPSFSRVRLVNAVSSLVSPSLRAVPEVVVGAGHALRRVGRDEALVDGQPVVGGQRQLAVVDGRRRDRQVRVVPHLMRSKFEHAAVQGALLSADNPDARAAK